MFSSFVARLKFILIRGVHVTLAEVSNGDRESIKQILLGLLDTRGLKINEDVVPFNVVVGH